jgi:phosphoglycerate dehydrogenase-like enzyme
MTPTITLLDDYQQVAVASADWSALRQRYLIDAVREHIAERDDLVARLADSEVVVAMRERTPLDANLFDRLPNLRLDVTTGMKNASIDVAHAAERGITVCGTRTRPSGVSELVVGMLITVMRSISVEDAAMHRGGWQHTIGPGLQGSRLGLLGLGAIGARVARLLDAFEMDVVAWTPNLTAERAATHRVRAVERDELLSTADAVSVHAPLNETTRGMIGAGELALMKPTAYLINTSRGPLVDESALVAALRSGSIAGAALDVYDVEPLPPQHPLRELPNALLLPHIGYVTTNAYEVFYPDAVGDIAAYLAGAPIRVVSSPA